jgi:hypothetical protein
MAEYRTWTGRNCKQTKFPVSAALDNSLTPMIKLATGEIYLYFIAFASCHLPDDY